MRHSSAHKLFSSTIAVLSINLCMAGGALSASDTSSGPAENNDRATNCRSAGGTVSESGGTLTCTLRDDTGKQCSVVCKDGGGCAASGAGCDEFGGADAITAKRAAAKPRPPGNIRPSPVPGIEVR